MARTPQQISQLWPRVRRCECDCECECVKIRLMWLIVVTGHGCEGACVRLMAVGALACRFCVQLFWLGR